MGFTIGVVGASGGLGASTLTAALAFRGAAVLDDCTSAVAVDLDPRGGLDTTLCLEHVPGTRWEDLLDDGAGLVGPTSLRVSDLPGEDGVAVLSGGDGRPPPAEIVLEALDLLGPLVDLVAVDCGPRPPAHILSRLDLLVVLAAGTARGLHDAVALSRACALSRTMPVLVSRGAPRDRSGPSLARRLGLPFLAHLGDDTRVPRQSGEGLAPGVVRSAVDGVADEALALAQSRWLATLVHRLGAEESTELSWTA